MFFFVGFALLVFAAYGDTTSIKSFENYNERFANPAYSIHLASIIASSRFENCIVKKKVWRSEHKRASRAVFTRSVVLPMMALYNAPFIKYVAEEFSSFQMGDAIFSVLTKADMRNYLAPKDGFVARIMPGSFCRDDLYGFDDDESVVVFLGFDSTAVNQSIFSDLLVDSLWREWHAQILCSSSPAPVPRDSVRTPCKAHCSGDRSIKKPSPPPPPPPPEALNSSTWTFPELLKLLVYLVDAATSNDETAHFTYSCLNSILQTLIPKSQLFRLHTVEGGHRIVRMLSPPFTLIEPDRFAIVTPAVDYPLPMPLHKLSGPENYNLYMLATFPDGIVPKGAELAAIYAMIPKTTTSAMPFAKILLDLLCTDAFLLRVKSVEELKLAFRQQVHNLAYPTFLHRILISNQKDQ